MSEPLIIMFGSSLGIGLLFHTAELAKELQRQGSEVWVLSGPGELCEGIEEGLNQASIPLLRYDDLDKPITAPMGKALKFLRRIVSLADGPVAFLSFGLKHCLLADKARDLEGRQSLARNLIMITSLRHGTSYERVAYRIGAHLMNVSADRIMALCADEYRKLIQAGIDRKRCSILHNWLDVSAYETKPDCSLPAQSHPRRLLSLAGMPFPQSVPIATYGAQLIPRKGHRYLFKALRILNDQGSPVACIAMGDGPERNSLVRYVNKLGVAHLVAMPGYIHQKLVPLVLANSELVVISSLAETFGYAIAEPLLAGVPLVTTRVGIAGEIEGVGGAEVVWPRDSYALAQAIYTVVRNPTSARAKAEVGAEYVREYCSTEYIARQLRTLIQDSFGKGC